jgi:hypothetical protein
MPAPPRRPSTFNAPAPIARSPLVRPPSRLPGSRPAPPLRGPERIEQELGHRLAAQEATEILAAAGGAAVSRMHAGTHGLYLHTAGVIVARTEALPPDTLRRHVEDWNAAQLAAYKRHLLGVLEAGAYAVAEKVEQAFDEAPEPLPESGFWQRWLGGPRPRR